MSEEVKAIKRLEEITNNYKLNSEDLHCAKILYYLIINLQQENEKLNHYKLLYQKVKERNEKAVTYIEDRYDFKQKVLTHTFDKDNVGELLELLEGNNEIQ